MRNETVLVDGAAGYLGRRVVKELLAVGFRVRATDLPGTDLSYAKDLGAEIVYADLLDREAISRAMAGADYVVHAAALFSLTADRETLRQVNVTGTENILAAAAENNIRHFIHISTSDVYGTLKYLPGDENHPQNPINDYAVSKKEGEAVVWRYSKERRLPVTVVRPSAIYGPGSVYIAGVFFFWPIVIRLSGIPYYPFIRGGSKLTFAYIDDVAGAVGFLLGRNDAFGEAYNIADEEYIYSANFASELCRSFGVKNLLPFSIPLPHLVVDLYGKAMLFVSGLMLRVLNRWVKRRWERLRKKFGLTRGFTPHFERQFYCYFIGHRYFSSKKIKDLGYRFRNQSFYSGYPATLQWYIENKWIPPLAELGKRIKGA